MISAASFPEAPPSSSMVTDGLSHAVAERLDVGAYGAAEEGMYLRRRAVVLPALFSGPVVAVAAHRKGPSPKKPR